jgi:hypothetical protein
MKNNPENLDVITVCEAMVLFVARPPDRAERLELEAFVRA